MNITKTVYSICYPQTKLEFEKYRRKMDLGHMYEETWSKKQDILHMDFFNAWNDWISPRFKYNKSNLNKFYPTAGSSEAIREQIVYLNSLGKRLVVFYGEYEGYEAIANAIKMPLLKINRPNIDNMDSIVKDLNAKTDVLFLSQPSSIDGNFWIDFKLFLSKANKYNISIYVDLACLGASKQKEVLDITQDFCVDGIFFSLSKTFGVYYHRIGGCILKEENPLLYGNMWFKNLFSLGYGVELLTNSSIGFNDDYLEDLQAKSIEVLSNQYNVEFKPSDIYLLATIKKDELNHVWQKDLIRDDKSNRIRVCMSPLIEKLINTM